ncbi:MAG: IS4 family transposase [Ignavibacteriales bacterium]|nr:IS4 family transposase [Ignavibacteriales bacterium]
MKANSPNSGSIVKMLGRIPLCKLSKVSGFCKRKPKKISPKDFILGFFLMLSCPGIHSFEQWANKIGQLTNKLISKQALWKRMQPQVLLFLQMVLAHVITDSMRKVFEFTDSKKVKLFKNIILEDATHIQLNDNLAEDYPGNAAANHKTRKALLKLQVCYNLTKAKFERFHITNFRKNDQSYSEEIVDIVKSGDLLIRDLGYYVLSVFQKLQNKGVSYISRFRIKTNVYLHKDDDKPIDLAKMLSKRGSLDISVFLGVKDRLPVRLVALPVEESVASERRRRARLDQNKRNVMAKDKLFLLGWELFITNIEKEKLTASDIAAFYFLRWRIEIIFKCWKSCMKVERVPIGCNKIRLEAYIYCVLIFVILLQVNVYRYYVEIKTDQKKKNNNGYISLMKLTKFFADNINNIILQDYPKNSRSQRLLEKRIIYYCRYDIRTDRLNFQQRCLI